MFPPLLLVSSNIIRSVLRRYRVWTPSIFSSVVWLELVNVSRTSHQLASGGQELQMRRPGSGDVVKRMGDWIADILGGQSLNGINGARSTVA